MQRFDPQTVLRPELGELKAYTPHLGTYEVRLDANEAPPLLGAPAKKKLAEAAAKTAWHQYPDAGQKDLRKAIAKRMGVKPNQVIVGVGSDELITLLLTVASRAKARAPAPTVLTTTPTFVMYRLSARIRGQRVMEVPLDADWDLDEAGMLRAIDMAQPNVIFIASPNNPTGTMVTRSRLETVIEAAKSSIVVVDEAYVDYADQHQLDLLEKYENVVILRTLSKIGFAALRIGWLVGSAALVAELDKARLPYNLPTVSQTLGTLVLEELGDDISHICSYVKQERARLTTQLATIRGVTVVPSQANFLWLKLDVPSGDVFTRLGKLGVLVRSFHGRGGRLEQCLRVTVGTKEQNDRFIDALREAL
ncbi:MAG TPA: histidinol-phosphate transaminase [Polyangiaceae bacterium]|nr:histidinol-phosphate transaminase [Polyangiaceae bacterium]